MGNFSPAQQHEKGHRCDMAQTASAALCTTDHNSSPPAAQTQRPSLTGGQYKYSTANKFPGNPGYPGPSCLCQQLATWAVQSSLVDQLMSRNAADIGIPTRMDIPTRIDTGMAC